MLVLPLNLILSQPLAVVGKVVDNTNGTALIGATVLLEGEKTYATVTKAEGTFQFRSVAPGVYSLTISYVGYAQFVLKDTYIDGGHNFAEIRIDEQRTTVEEVVVEGKIPLATTKGDTIEFNADAYTTNPDADAEDLIKKMPGIEVDEGKVQAQGEDVKKVYVDGKPFFDQDPTLALRSLPAEVIQKIEVFDEQSEQAKFTGFDDGETTKVMNIVTRANMKNGQFGKAFASVGYPDKYHLGGNINFFNGNRRISLIGQSNNINQQNFSDEDLLGVVGTSGRRGSGFKGRGGKRRGGGRSGSSGVSSSDFMIGAQPGISKTTALGLNYSDSWGKKIDVSGSYFFNQSVNDSEQEVFQQYLSETKLLDQTYTESNIANSRNYNHRVHFKFDYDINKNNKLMIRPRLSYQSNQSTSEIIGNSWLSDTLINKNINLYHADRLGYNLSNQILYKHAFEKRGRTFSINLNTRLGDKLAENTQQTERIEEDLSVSDSLNQLNDYTNTNKQVSTRFVYTEPIGGNGLLMINSNSSVAYENGNRKAYQYDYADNTYATFDTALSNVFTSKYITQALGAGLRFRKDRNYLTLGLNYELANLSSEQEFPVAYAINRSFHSIHPSLRFRYRVSDNKNMNVMLRSNSREPTVEQLQNTIDNSNPLQYTIGNPDLKPTNEKSLFVRYNSTNREKATVFFVMLGARYAQRYIGNATWFAISDTLLDNSIVLQQGGQLKQTVNLNNYWNARSFITYGMPILKIKSNLNLNLSYTYAYIPSMLNDVVNHSVNQVLGTGIVLSSNISERIDFTLRSNTRYNTTANTIGGNANTTFIRQKSEADLSLILWGGVVFRAAFGSQYYYWTDTKNSESYVILNMELGKKIFKDDLGEVKLSIFDALNQNTNLTRTVKDGYVEDVQTNVLQQFFMLSFVYRLRNFGSTSANNNPPIPRERRLNRFD